MKTKKNLLVLGACGTLAHTVLTYLKNHRHLFRKLYLLDKEPFRDDNFRSLTNLDASFVRLNLTSRHAKKFSKLLKDKKIDLVLDLSDADTELTSQLIFDYGKASYICCGLSTSSYAPLGEALNEWIDAQKNKPTPKMPHIFFTGMNPGAVNVWAAIGIKKFGVPKEIIEFEYDTSRFMKHHKEKMVTWCIPEFVVELVTDPAEIILGDHKIKSMFPNGLYHTENLEPLFSPVWKLKSYPRGCMSTHEECVTLGNKHNIPAKFIYTVNQETMDFIRKTYKEKGKVEESDLVIGSNVGDSLLGSDNVALRLDYEDRAVYYFNSASNENLKECSGTDYQVATGVYAALFTLLFSDLKPGIHYTEDLLGTIFPKFLTDNMMIQEFVFEKQGKRLKQISHDPHINYGKGEFIKM
ncbi:hypothetical protein A2974_02830 [Candidatus Peregrinibacteria bacterium RIFCSPLOWO2_01_FULL_48_20]|nr:MAG: hypothetical protein A2974_02830 [Candidatus Peregrinibacteria bacterium RIFCSPLOWO2_01_FULL_48_20]